jgi:predicted RNA polymerase sigma factor
MTNKKRLSDDPLGDAEDSRDPKIPSHAFTALDGLVEQTVAFDEHMLSQSTEDDPVRTEDAISQDPNDKLLTVLRMVWHPDNPLGLTAEDREVITLRLLNRSTHREIARALGLSGPGQAQKVMLRAVRKIGKFFSKDTKDLE